MQKELGNHIKIDPYIYSFCMLYQFLSIELEKKKTHGIIFLDELINIPQQLKILYPSLSFNNHSIIEQALFLESKDTNFLQIVDVFTFYVCQYLNIKKEYKKYSELKTNHCINNYNKLITKTNLHTTEFLNSFFPKDFFYKKNGQRA